ncbi:MAG: neutral/alkaline non-lysosomal ceramidase N-terminal domain-containing protein [Phycisphaerae bacterium]
METNPRKSRKPRRRRVRRWLIAAAMLLAMLGLVGPWPVDFGPWENAQWARRTFARMTNWPEVGASGRFLAGSAGVELPCSPGDPMAGYVERDPMTGLGQLEPLYARAVTVSNGHRTVTILSAEILLFLPQLRDAVLQRTALDREEIYFTSSHTHSGPGGYAAGFIDQFIMGDYDSTRLNALAEACAQAVRASRRALQPARLHAGWVLPVLPDGQGVVENRVVGGPADARLWVIRIDGPDGMIAAVVICNAHPTALGDENRHFSGDWPGRLALGLEERFGGVILPVAGSVGSARLRSGCPRGPQRLAEAVSAMLPAAAGLLEQLGGATGDRDGQVLVRSAHRGPIVSRILQVDLPVQQYRISESLRLSPAAVSLVHDRKSYLHVLRIGPVMLAGQPGDYSEALGAELIQQGLRRSQVWLSTSFNGDYIGYIVPRSYYATGNYEVRTANFFGPWCGEYLTALATSACGRIMNRSPAGQEPPPEGS